MCALQSRGIGASRIIRNCAGLFARNTASFITTSLFLSVIVGSILLLSFILGSFFFAAVFKISLIPTIAFKLKSRRREQLPKFQLFTVWALYQGVITHTLKDFQAVTASFTLIFIRRHIYIFLIPTFFKYAQKNAEDEKAGQPILTLIIRCPDFQDTPPNVMISVENLIDYALFLGYDVIKI